jgi:hypothetical protein
MPNVIVHVRWYECYITILLVRRRVVDARTVQRSTVVAVECESINIM